MMKFDNSTPHSAEKYDSQIRCIIPYYDSFHEETINLIKATQIEPQTWLDTGCGTGTFAERALAAFPKTHFILADPSEEVLLVAKKKFAHITARARALSTSSEIESKVEILRKEREQK
jgi:tRNA (cmo5U34)-methyltransferase